MAVEVGAAIVAVTVVAAVAGDAEGEGVGLGSFSLPEQDANSAAKTTNIRLSRYVISLR